MRLTVHRTLFLSHFAAVALISGSIGALVYRAAVDAVMDSLRARLTASAALLARVLDPVELDPVSSPAAVDSEVYRTTLARIRELQATDPDISFVYVMRLQAGKVLFVVDSDRSRSQALPGQEYAEAPTTLVQGFAAPSADDEITADRWGHFLSGYAPLPKGRGRYLVGVDMRADVVHSRLATLRATAVVALLLSLALAGLLAWLVSRRLTAPLDRLRAALVGLAQGRTTEQLAVAEDDDFGELSAAFAQLSERLVAGRAETARTIAEVRAAGEEVHAALAASGAEVDRLRGQLAQEISDRTQAEEALAHAATSETLTGLMNRSAMLRLLNQEVERVRRTTEPFSIILADVDQLHEVNRRHGPGAGDQVLQQLAALLQDCVRAQDAVARWGGDEFLLFLPETDRDGAVAVAKKLTVAVAECPQLVGGLDVRVTFSLGVAAARLDEPVNEFLRRADTALAAAQAAGGNRTELAR
jgi:diguanylate cyclase (GGDEF)-like protein